MTGKMFATVKLVRDGRNHEIDKVYLVDSGTEWDFFCNVYYHDRFHSETEFVRAECASLSGCSNFFASKTAAPAPS